MATSGRVSSPIDKYFHGIQMKKSTAIEHFKNEFGIAKALGISRQAVNIWGDVVPYATALELQHLTGGVIKRDPTLYENRVPKPQKRSTKRGG